MNVEAVHPRREFKIPHLILITGPPGVGKTILARELLRYVSCAYVDNNALADAFFTNTRRSPEYVAIRTRLYEQLYRIISDNLKMGNSVIVDVPFVKQSRDATWQSYISDFAKRNDAVLFGIKCNCSDSLLMERLRQRGADRDKWKLANWSEFRKEEPIDYELEFDHLPVVTEQHPSVLAQNILEHIRKRLH